MNASYPRLAMPPCDRRTREYRAVSAKLVELQRRLGPAPSFGAREIAEQILATALDVALLERQRHEEGALNTRNHEILGRGQNRLARLLDRLEHAAPPPAEPSLRERIEQRRQAAVA